MVQSVRLQEVTLKFYHLLLLIWVFIVAMWLLNSFSSWNAKNRKK